MSKIYRPFQPTLTHYGLKQFALAMESEAPCEVLRGKVFSYLQIKAKIPTPYPVMPDGTQAVYVSPRGLMIGGAQLSARDIHILEPGEYFGVWFYPGALRNFFDLNLSEITGQFVDKCYFECRRFSELHNEIYEKDSFKERVNICESWLLSRYLPKSATNFDIALQFIYQSFGSERVSRVAKNVGWSTRHLNRQFLQHAGLTTKSFSQVVKRFCKSFIKSLCEKVFTLILSHYKLILTNGCHTTILIAPIRERCAVAERHWKHCKMANGFGRRSY